MKKDLIDQIDPENPDETYAALDGAKPTRMIPASTWEQINGMEGAPHRYLMAAGHAALLWEDVIISLEVLTPKRAKYYLAQVPDRGRCNRRLSKSALEKLKKAKREGRWVFNGDTIVFNEEDYLIDGQTRCQMCIDLNCSILVIVVRGVKRRAFASINTGKPKMFSDMLEVRGRKSSRTLGAALKIVDTYLRTGRITEFSYGYTPDMAPEIDQKYSTMSRYLTTLHLIENVFNPALGVALHFLFAKKDEKLAEEFFNRLGKNILQGESDHLWHLERRLREMRKENKSDKVGVNREIAAALIIKTWNAMRQGTKASKRNLIYVPPYRDSETNQVVTTEPFPTIL